MVNFQDHITGDGSIKRFKVDDLLFVEYKCIVDDRKQPIWWHDNYFSFVVKGEMIWKTSVKEYTVRPGELYFVKKGGFVARSRFVNEYCDVLIFVPDDFIKGVVEKYKLKIMHREDRNPKSDIVVPCKTDEVLTTYFRSLLALLQQPDPPSGALLRIKFEELMVSLITRETNAGVNEYFRQLCLQSKVPVQEIMEANFFNDLSLLEFARLCSRSLTVFKHDFKNIYHMTPGKWLQEKRLEYSRFLLETTGANVDEVFVDSGFKNGSHFNRAFKNKYGVTPGKYRSFNKDVSTNNLD